MGAYQRQILIPVPPYPPNLPKNLYPDEPPVGSLALLQLKEKVGVVEKNCPVETPQDQEKIGEVF